MTDMKISVIATNQDWVGPHLEVLDSSDIHGLYIADHPSFPTTDSWTWLAYAAAKTNRIKLGTHVTGAPYHHPTRLAKQVVSVDVLSGGRAVFGVGTAYEVHDFRPYGYQMGTFRERLKYTEDLILAMNQMFTGKITGFKSQFFEYEGETEFAPLPVNGHIPVWIGLNRAGLALKVAARVADAINTWQLSPKQVQEVATQLEKEVEVAGRNKGEVAVTCDVVMVRDGSRDDAEATALHIRSLARSWGRSESVTDWGTGGVLYGDPDMMCEQSLQFAAAGCSELTIAVNSIDDINAIAALAAMMKLQ